jgi:hypothetical protein
MENFLEAAISNKIGVWLGRAEIEVPDKFLRGACYKNKSVIANLMGLSTNSKFLKKIYERGFSSYSYIPGAVNIRYLKNLNGIRVSDKNLEKGYGIVSRPAILKCGQFDVHEDGIGFYFHFRFDKKFNFPGYHRIHIRLTAVDDKIAILPEDKLLRYSPGYHFLVEVEKKLMDKCNNDPEIFAELKRKFPIQ